MLVFVSVAKHARFVLAMKILCALIAVILVSLLITLPLLSPVEKKFKLSISSIDTANEKGAQTMEKPRFQGVDSQNEPYNIVADRATQKTQDKFLLENIVADMTLQGGGWVSLTSKEGLLSVAGKMVDLTGAVHIFSDDGYEAFSESAHIDIKKNMISGKQPIHMQGPLGILDARGFILWQNDKKMIFTGPVHMKIYVNK